MRWVGHVACIGDVRNRTFSLRNHLRDLGVDGRIALTWNLNRVWGPGLDSPGWRQGPVAKSCKHGNDPLGFIKGGGIWLSDYEILRMHSAPYSQELLNISPETESHQTMHSRCSKVFVVFLSPTGRTRNLKFKWAVNASFQILSKEIDSHSGSLTCIRGIPGSSSYWGSSSFFKCWDSTLK
jgi:hypothetical protein